jgi:hypothetical protein
MPAFLFVLVVRVVEAVCRQWRKARAPKPRPLCTECSHAHVQYAVNGRRAIACTFAGAVRPVLLDVMYCTDYRDRNAAPRLVSWGSRRAWTQTSVRKPPSFNTDSRLRESLRTALRLLRLRGGFSERRRSIQPEWTGKAGRTKQFRRWRRLRFLRTRRSRVQFPSWVSRARDAADVSAWHRVAQQ